MAINFEAANMAGYNNPKIEVFKAHVNENMEVTYAPMKSEIYDSLNRGRIPFILLSITLAAITQHLLLGFAGSSEDTVNNILYFAGTHGFNAEEAPTTVRLLYGPADNALPTFA